MHPAQLLAPLLAAAPPAAAGAGQGRVRISLFEAFFIQRNPATGEVEVFGSLIIWLLLALSVVATALIVRMALENRRRLIIPDGVLRRVEGALAERDVARAARVADESDSHLGAVAAAAVRELPVSMDASLRALELASDEYTSRRLRRIEPLHTIGAVAPMLGLFGTVYGMILAFREIVSSGGAPDPVGLAAGIGTALTTTFWGLVVAIPSLAAYAFIRDTIDAHTSEAALTVEEALARHRVLAGAASTLDTAAEPGQRIRAAAGG